MATSGTTTFNLDVNELLEEAYERASNGSREMRTGYDFRTARRSLNLLTLEWASRGLNLWTLESGTIPLVQGTAQYTLPGDTIDLIEHYIRQNTGVNQNDLTVSRISVSTYAALTNKNITGRPNQIFIERRVDTPRVNLWPVPDSGAYTLYYWRMRRMQDSGTGANTQDIPYRLLPCLVAGLAYYLSMKIPEGAMLTDKLNAEYMRQWDIAAGEDRDRASVRFVPRAM